LRPVRLRIGRRATAFAGLKGREGSLRRAVLHEAFTSSPPCLHKWRLQSCPWPIELLSFGDYAATALWIA
jgi:hypothetical protein